VDLFRTKSVAAARADVAAEDGDGHGRLRRRLSARHLVGLRHRDRHRHRQLSPALPLVAAACPYPVLDLSGETWLRVLAWLVLGLLVHAGYGYRHSRVRATARRETLTR
jgi:hypothetical protein